MNRVYSYATGRRATGAEKAWIKGPLLTDFAAGHYKFPFLLRRLALDPGFYLVKLPQTIPLEASTAAVEQSVQ